MVNLKLKLRKMNIKSMELNIQINYLEEASVQLKDFEVPGYQEKTFVALEFNFYKIIIIISN